MGLSRNDTQVTWSAANSLAVVPGGIATSDAVTLLATSVACDVEIKVANGGTPTFGDEVELRLLHTLGDTDAEPDTADEYETVKHSQVVRVVDTNAENPVVVILAGIEQAKLLKVYAKNNGASSVTVSATVRETSQS